MDIAISQSVISRSVSLAHNVRRQEDVHFIRFHVEAKTFDQEFRSFELNRGLKFEIFSTKSSLDFKIRSKQFVVAAYLNAPD